MNKKIILAVGILIIAGLGFAQIQLSDYGNITIETKKDSTLVYRDDIGSFQSDTNADEIIAPFNFTMNGETRLIGWNISKNPAVARGQIQELINLLEEPEPGPKPKPEPQNIDINMIITMVKG